MRLSLENTDRIVELIVNGVAVPARLWQGETASGAPVHAYVVRVGVAGDADLGQFQAELVECAAPRPDVAAIPARLIL